MFKTVSEVRMKDFLKDNNSNALSRLITIVTSEANQGDESD